VFKRRFAPAEKDTEKEENHLTTGERTEESRLGVVPRRGRIRDIFVRGGDLGPEAMKSDRWGEERSFGEKGGGEVISFATAAESELKFGKEKSNRGGQDRRALPKGRSY